MARPSSHPRFPFLNIFLWGNSVALSWVWGLGLFFSVQFTVEFGLTGLLTFLIPNCLGLFLFGATCDVIAKRNPGSESLAAFFTNWSRPFRLVFFLYQIIALSLTIFALIRYGWQPLGLRPDSLYLPLTALIILAAGILFGEEFSIRRIKYSHAAFLALILCCAAVIVTELGSPYFRGIHSPSLLPTHDLNFWGYVIPICIGFLVGPWLDLQQWQRAIQMRRENTSITAAYAFGALLFGTCRLPLCGVASHSGFQFSSGKPLASWSLPNLPGRLYPNNAGQRLHRLALVFQKQRHPKQERHLLPYSGTPAHLTHSCLHSLRGDRRDWCRHRD